MKKWRYLIIGFLAYVGVICLVGIIEQRSPDANIKSVSDAFWYAIVTLTTVGYGDFFPVTPLGKIVGLFLIVGSIGILGFIIGEITNRYNQYMEKKKNGFWGTDFENHYLIIGWNEFSHQVADQIFNAGHKVAFVVNSKTNLELIADLYPDDNCFCLFADFQNFDSFAKVNISKSKGVFVAFENDTDTLVYVLNLKTRFPTANIVVKCNNAELKKTFVNAGIKHVVAQCEVASKMVASHIFEPQVALLTEDLIATSVDDADFDLQQYKLIQSNALVGKTYIDAFLELKKKFNSVAVGLATGGTIIKNPADDVVLKTGDYLILISDGNSKKNIESAFGVKEGA